MVYFTSRCTGLRRLHTSLACWKLVMMACSWRHQVLRVTRTQHPVCNVQTVHLTACDLSFQIINFDNALMCFAACLVAVCWCKLSGDCYDQTTV